MGKVHMEADGASLRDSANAEPVFGPEIPIAATQPGCALVQVPIFEVRAACVLHYEVFPST